MLCMLVVAAVQDVRSGKISNRLIVTGLIMGLIIQVMEHRICGVYYFLRNISVPVVLLYLLFQMRVLGAGDIKLFSMIGSILTIGELFRCMVYGFAAAGAGAVLFLAVDRRRWQRIQYGVHYVLDFLYTKKLKPYQPPYPKEAFSYAFSVPVLFGVILALYFPVSY